MRLCARALQLGFRVSEIQVRRFIDINRDVLLDYWEKRIDADELRKV